MPTKEPRLNVTLAPDIRATLVNLATSRDQSLSSLAEELIIDALERQEDIQLSRMADLREQRVKKWHSHENAWK